MFGLRKINNNYVANGTGRDLTINFDSSFRGGRLGSGSLVQHWPKPFVDSPKVKKHMETGPDARVEAHTQTLNCSRSSTDFLRETKVKLRESAKFQFPLVGSNTLQTMMSSKASGASHGLLKAASMPSLDTCSSQFKPRWQVPAYVLDAGSPDIAQDSQPAVTGKKSNLPDYWRPKDPFLDWPAPSYVRPQDGFARTDGGSPWPH